MEKLSQQGLEGSQKTENNEPLKVHNRSPLRFDLSTSTLIVRPCNSPGKTSEFAALSTTKPYQPHIYHDLATGCLSLFSGHLMNLDELTERYQPYTNSPTTVIPSSPGEQAAEILLHMYRKERSAGPLVFLSELQGEYSFLIYDAEKKITLAASDGSGSHRLFYEIDEGKGLSISNAIIAAPHTVWTELPPGHYILKDRQPIIKQFALSRDELYQRTREEELSFDDDVSPASISMSDEFDNMSLQ